MEPIQIKNLSLFLPHKNCFSNFTTDIHYGSHIGIIGDNGSGKSTLLQILTGNIEPSEGSINLPENTIIGYMPQIIEEFTNLSGGQRLNHALSQALCLDSEGTVANPNLKFLLNFFNFPNYFLVINCSYRHYFLALMTNLSFISWS